ncbi:MAG: alginate lyase family protein [bacterium]
MTRLHHFFLIIRYFGFSWLLFRVWYWFQIRTGIIKARTPIQSWADIDLEQFLKNRDLQNPENYYAYRIKEAPVFFIPDKPAKNSEKIFKSWDSASCDPVKKADTIANGIFTYFSFHQYNCGLPPDWFYDPFNTYTYPRENHWSNIQEFKYKDIKNIWELNRFGFVYDLIRAYYRTGNDQYARIFWQLVEDWHKHNPPNQGPNWKCGQEITFRVMAWCFGLYAFLSSKETTPERMSKLAQMIAVSGKRIDKNISYALSQNNNHSISEAVGLYTIGLLFPEFKKAVLWKEKGKELLESLGQKLIYADGSFSQHSLNYHRLMLRDYLWALRLGDINNDPFSSALKEKLLQACLYLYHLQYGETRRVPNYGQNDGALILPLNNCEFYDFRPVVQSMYFLLTGNRCYTPGPWDEDLYWIFGESALKVHVDSITEENLKAEEGGYYTIRSSESFMFTRCASFRHRPSQADMLHMDLFWKGQNIATDPGTYSYHAEEPWNNPFAETTYHNTVSVDSRDQMERSSPFMWLPWIKGQVLRNQVSPSGNLHVWEGEHNGYQRLKKPVFYNRAILKLGTAQWLVLDRLYSQSVHDYRLHWLLAYFPHTFSQKNQSLILNTPKGAYHIFTGEIAGVPDISIETADKSSPRGWRSQYYNQKEPALSLCLKNNVEEAVFYTLFTPYSADITTDSHYITIESKNKKISVNFGSKEDHLISEISVQGQPKETWVLG